MRKIVSYMLTLMCLVSSIHGAPPSYEEEDEAPGNFFNGAKYDSATYNSIGVSMITWGLGLAAGITALTLLIDQSATKKTKSSHTTPTNHCTCNCTHCHN
jgi:hypothetical protein